MFKVLNASGCAAVFITFPLTQRFKSYKRWIKFCPSDINLYLQYRYFDLFAPLFRRWCIYRDRCFLSCHVRGEKGKFWVLMSNHTSELRIPRSDPFRCSKGLRVDSLSLNEKINYFSLPSWKSIIFLIVRYLALPQLLLLFIQTLTMMKLTWFEFPKVKRLLFKLQFASCRFFSVFKFLVYSIASNNHIYISYKLI